MGHKLAKTSQPTGSVALPQPLVARTNKMEPDESEEANSERETERQRAINGWDRNREIEEARRQQTREIVQRQQAREELQREMSRRRNEHRGRCQNPLTGATVLPEKATGDSGPPPCPTRKGDRRQRLPRPTAYTSAPRLAPPEKATGDSGSRGRWHILPPPALPRQKR